jgi:hypothetical protein
LVPSQLHFECYLGQNLSTSADRLAKWRQKEKKGMKPSNQYAYGSIDWYTKLMSWTGNSRSRTRNTLRDMDTGRKRPSIKRGWAEVVNLAEDVIQVFLRRLTQWFHRLFASPWPPRRRVYSPKLFRNARSQLLSPRWVYVENKVAISFSRSFLDLRRGIRRTRLRWLVFSMFRAYLVQRANPVEESKESDTRIQLHRLPELHS